MPGPPRKNRAGGGCAPPPPPRAARTSAPRRSLGGAALSAPVRRAARGGAGRGGARAWLLGVLGWLVPGLGHLAQKKFDRAAVFFVSICALAALGLAMGAKLYGPPFVRDQGLFLFLLHVLGFVGDLGAGP